MNEKPIRNKKIAILATDGFEESELFESKETLEKVGGIVDIISLNKGSIKAWNKDTWGRTIRVDFEASAADATEYDALLIPGGVMNPDKLRASKEAIRFANQFANAGKPIAAICHGPWVLVEMGILDGRHVTSWPSLKSDLKNAGAHWVDSPVVVDNGLITSRKPEDIQAFCKKLTEEIMLGAQRVSNTKKIDSDRAVMT
jgi:protease I